jgi:hypothetical protein
MMLVSLEIDVRLYSLLFYICEFRLQYQFFESKLTFFLFKMHDLLNGLTILFYINLTYNVE